MLAHTIEVVVHFFAQLHNFRVHNLQELFMRFGLGLHQSHEVFPSGVDCGFDLDLIGWHKLDFGFLFEHFVAKGKPLLGLFFNFEIY